MKLNGLKKSEFSQHEIEFSVLNVEKNALGIIFSILNIEIEFFYYLSMQSLYQKQITFSTFDKAKVYFKTYKTKFQN